MDENKEAPRVPPGAAADEQEPRKNGAGPSADVAAAVEAALHPSAAQRQKDAENQMRAAQARAMAGQQRLAIATSLLSGMCAGVYGKLHAGEIEAGFGERMIKDALAYADKLMLGAIQPPAPPAANG